MAPRIRRRITTAKRDEIERQEKEISLTIVRPFEILSDMPVSFNPPPYGHYEDVLKQPLTVKDTAVLYKSLLKSRYNYVYNPPMFKLYWMKLTAYARKLQQQEFDRLEASKNGNLYVERKPVLESLVSARDVMVKLCDSTMLIGPHTLGVRLFIAKDERSEKKDKDKKNQEENSTPTPTPTTSTVERPPLASTSTDISQTNTSGNTDSTKEPSKPLTDGSSMQNSPPQESPSLQDADRTKADPNTTLEGNKPTKEETGMGEISEDGTRESEELLKSVQSEKPSNAKGGEVGEKGSEVAEKKQAENLEMEKVEKSAERVDKAEEKVENTEEKVEKDEKDEDKVKKNETEKTEEKTETVKDKVETDVNNTAKTETITNTDTAADVGNVSIDVHSKDIPSAPQDAPLAAPVTVTAPSHPAPSQPAPPPPPKPPAKPASDPNDMTSVENTIMIANLNAIARVDQSLGTLMKIVALGLATPQQIMRFQVYIQRARDMGPQPHHHHLLGPNHPLVRQQQQQQRQQQQQQQQLREQQEQQGPIKEKRTYNTRKMGMAREIKLTAFQEKYVHDAQLLFEFVDNPNVRYALPRDFICEVTKPPAPPVDDDDEQQSEVLISFLWIHNIEEYEVYEKKFAVYEKALKERQLEEEKKYRQEQEEEAKRKEEEAKELRELETQEGDAASARRARRRTAPPPPKKVTKPKPPKKLVAPTEPEIRYTPVSFTLTNVPGRYLPILINSTSKLEVVQKKMAHILKVGSRMPSYYLWYQVDGKLDEKFAEDMRLDVLQDEKRMTGVVYTSSSAIDAANEKKRKAKEEKEEKQRQKKLKKLQALKERASQLDGPPRIVGYPSRVPVAVPPRYNGPATVQYGTGYQPAAQPLYPQGGQMNVSHPTPGQTSSSLSTPASTPMPSTISAPIVSPSIVSTPPAPTPPTQSPPLDQSLQDSQSTTINLSSAPTLSAEVNTTQSSVKQENS